MGAKIEFTHTVENIEEGQGLALAFAIATILIQTYPEIKDKILEEMDNIQSLHFWIGQDVQSGYNLALDKLRSL